MSLFEQIGEKMEESKGYTLYLLAFLIMGLIYLPLDLLCLWVGHSRSTRWYLACTVT